MSRAGLLIVVAGIAIAGGVVLARAESRQLDNVRVTLNGSFTPRSLPRDRLVPVTTTIEGRIATTDGSQPPPLRELEVDLNRNGHVETKGLPRCRAATLQSTSTSLALARCRGALVGHGSFHASFDFGNGAPVASSGATLVFNSRLQGRPSLLLHFYTAVPVEAGLVLPLRLEHKPDRALGLVLRTKIPKLAGETGSITALKLTLGRSYAFHGERRGYISASCGAPAGFPGAVFPFLRGTFSFVEGRRITINLERNCKVSGA